MPANTQDVQIKSHCHKCQIVLCLWLVIGVGTCEEKHHSYSFPFTGNKRMYSAHTVCPVKFDLSHHAVVVTMDQPHDSSEVFGNAAGCEVTLGLQIVNFVI